MNGPVKIAIPSNTLGCATEFQRRRGFHKLEYQGHEGRGGGAFGTVYNFENKGRVVEDFGISKARGREVGGGWMEMLPVVWY